MDDNCDGDTKLDDWKLKLNKLAMGQDILDDGMTEAELYTNSIIKNQNINISKISSSFKDNQELSNILASDTGTRCSSIIIYLSKQSIINNLCLHKSHVNVFSDTCHKLASVVIAGDIINIGDIVQSYFWLLYTFLTGFCVPRAQQRMRMRLQLLKQWQMFQDV